MIDGYYVSLCKVSHFFLEKQNIENRGRIDETIHQKNLPDF